MPEPLVALTSGTRLGPYEIISAIGAGGMGEVYRAKDTRLDRIVAVKILPPLLAVDPQFRERFEREARAISQLTHPHICTLYDVGGAPSPDATGTPALPEIHFLVMEYLEGETLAERIRQGAIPWPEARAIAIQIADALERAHRAGIVHRDLKPSNVMLTATGVKLLDFGLAKAGTTVPTGAAAVSLTPTVFSGGTLHGTIQGTVAYMSPEQARGKTIDAQTDVWAFGCVLFEMLTARQAFPGDTATDIMAAVVTRDPDWEPLAAKAPAAVRRLVQRCLQKDQARRLRAIGDARFELEDAPAMEREAVAGPATPVKSAAWIRWLPWALASAFGLAVLAMLAWRGGNVVAPPVTRLELTLPPGVAIFPAGSSVAISPDGTRLAFVGIHAGARQVYLRALDQFDAAPQPGTDNAYTCFFSADGRTLAFTTPETAIKTLSLNGGLVETVIRNLDTLAGAAWTPDGRIVFPRDGALWAIPSTGGTPAQLTTLDAKRGEVGHRWPVAFPDGGILFSSFTTNGKGRLEWLMAGSGERRVLVDRATGGMYARSGHVVFFRDNALLAAPFDPKRPTAGIGSAVSFLEGIPGGFNGANPVALSQAGTLVYAGSGTLSGRLVWVARNGSEQPLDEQARSYTNPRVSPDGRRIVVQIGTEDLWLHDTARKTFTRLTLSQTHNNRWPVWSPDGRRLVFGSATGMRVLDVDGSGSTREIPGTNEYDLPSSISPDGRTLAFLRIQPNPDLYALSFEGDPKPRAIVSTPAYEGGPQFSPDGKWLAYVSNETGRMEVYVRPFPGPDRKWQVSTNGGIHPLWRRDGKELFYRDGNKMTAVSVSTTPELTLSTPWILFEGVYSFGSNATIPNYDVGPDGRFLFVKDEDRGGHFNVVLNWFEELARRAPVTGR